MKTAIIGGAGGMGKWLTNHFLKLGHSVIVSDPRIDQTQDPDIEIATNNKAAVDNADLVLISVPMKHSTEVIRDVIPHMKDESILCEISSLKSNVVEILRTVSKSLIKPLCIHPLFGPGASVLKKKFALIPIREEEEERELLKSLFPDSQVIIIDAGEHDRIMALTLSLPYFTNMILASILKNEDVSLIEQLGGTTFAVQFMLTGSIMSHTPEFHLSLHKENNYAAEMLRRLKSGIEDVLALLESNGDEFIRFYKDIKSKLEEQLNLEGKYQEMYRVLQVKEEQKEEGLIS
ncbi:MAG: prephenate dehydrogenase/arogenate dehydrogenase family protein [Candidatus Thorarchaeota archaeon]|nr:MAG: prephenate dehydrogenase/arogenate dehydrogenase family protein [Candidatus Thorarchaeota archaeon]